MVSLLSTESKHTTVNDVLASDVIDLKKAFENNVIFAKLAHVAQADQLVWQVLRTEAKVAAEKGRIAFFICGIH